MSFSFSCFYNKFGNKVLKFTASTQVKTFHSTSFCYHVNEKNNEFPAEATFCVALASSPCVRVGFLGGLKFPPTTQYGELVCLNWPSLSECQCVAVPCDGWASCPGWCPTFFPELTGKAPATRDPELN